ncbi:MAG: hypothetical protein AAGG99_01675 [Pseudomonadota bacterium]
MTMDRPRVSRSAARAIAAAAVVALAPPCPTISPANASEASRGTSQPGLEAVAVAFIGDGVNADHPTIAPCIARDGEGVPVGWDFIDNDVTPFARTDETTPHLVRAACARPAETDRSTLPPVRAVVLRVARENTPHLIEAIGFAAQTPAQVIVFDVTRPTPTQLRWARMASAQIPDRVFLIVEPQPAANDATGQAGPIPSNLLRISPTSAADGIVSATRVIHALAADIARAPDDPAAVRAARIASRFTNARAAAPPSPPTEPPPQGTPRP